MKNKIVIFMCFTVLLSLFMFNIPVYASNVNTYPFCCIFKNGSDPTYSIAVGWSSSINFTYSDGQYKTPSTVTAQIACNRWNSYYTFNSVAAAKAFLDSYEDFYTTGRFGGSPMIITIRGTATTSTPSDNFFGSYSDYLESIAPKWYEVLWDDFTEFVQDLAVDILTPFSPSSILHISEWLRDKWTVKVGEGEDNLADQIAMISPTPTPVPPTPIPYQTVIVPDGNGGSIIQYKYLNPSGTPIVTDQPPQQNVNVNIDNDNDFEYPYYENPENKDNPFKFKIPWYLKLVLKHNDIDIDTLDDHYQVAQNQVQSEDVVEAVNEVYNGFQVLPSDWLLLLGAIASIPLFAALIHRFLQG